MAEVNEETTAYLTVTFLDKTGVAASPTSSSYVVHDVKTGAEIKASTPIGPASSVEITLDKTDNTIQTASLGREKHRVTVNAIYGAGDELNDEFVYTVVNLSGV